MKPSDVLKEALKLIESGEEGYCCLAIKCAEYKCNNVRPWNSPSLSFQYFLRQCPVDIEYMGIAWWHPEDKQSRIEALQRAIVEAEGEAN